MALAAVLLAWRSAQATPIDVSQTLSRGLVSSKRSIEPLIDYTVFPWPYAYFHHIDRVDRFTNTSFDTVVTITGVEALALDPEDLGFADLTPANRSEVVRAAATSNPAASLWDVEDLPFSAYQSAWTSGTVEAQDQAGGFLAFPLTLAPQQSVLLHSAAFSLGAIESMGELVIGWQFDGSQTGGSPPLAGDVNRDGRINLSDFGVLKANLGATNASWSQGDLDRDGEVTLSDFGLFKKALGGTAAVPEPSSGLLAACAGILTACGMGLRRSRRS